MDHKSIDACPNAHGLARRHRDVAKPFCILHMSDLHRSPQEPISNDELISALVSDRDSYLDESPVIPAPDAIVVSGDIIQGVPLGTANHESKLADQYAVAEAFLDELVRRFLNEDRSRLVMVPGNHDVDWNTAFAALQVVDRTQIPQNLAAALYAEGSEYRWDWKTQTLFRIADPTLYERRLAAYQAFFGRFYAGISVPVKVQTGADANMFPLCDNRIGVAAFNSCHGNDCFAYHGMIRKEAVARSHLAFNDMRHVFDLRIAVWHHSVEGAPYRTDYMDVNIVRSMIGGGFRLGLHGHQHKAQAGGQRVWLSNEETMAIASAGSLCAGTRDLPTGTYRQYNLVEIAEDFRSARLHVRQMSVANLFSPARLANFGGKSFMELDWTPPRNIAGAVINTDAIRTQKTIEEAELALKTGDAKLTISILRHFSLPGGSYQRNLILDAAIAAEDWQTTIDVTDPPLTIAELVNRVNALCRMNRLPDAFDALDRHSKKLDLSTSIEKDLRRQLTAQERMRQ